MKFTFSILLSILLVISTPSFGAKTTCNMNDPDLKALNDDLKKNSGLLDAIKKNYDLLDAWDLLFEAGYKGNSTKRRDINNLTNLSNLLNNSKLSNSGVTTNQVKDLIKGNRGQGGVPLEDLITKFNTLVSSGTKMSNINRLISDLNNSGGNVAVGARWVLRYVLENTSDFSNKDITFEDSINQDRRLDLVVNKAGGNIHYELKSVLTAPPQRFLNQFINDLSAVNNLNQVKWVFDKKKLGSLNKQAFLDKLAQVENIDPAILDKFGDGTLEGLLENIDNNFTTIFEVK